MKKGDYFKGGFTIIEVVLVLAVAGLIFAMAFIAVPSLQRSQRDNDRRDDMLTFVSEIKRYQTSNRGNLPGSGDSDQTTIYVYGPGDKDAMPNTWSAFYGSYLGDRFVDPDGQMYTLKVMECKASRAERPCESAVIDAVNTMRDNSFDNNNYTMLVVTRAKCGSVNDATNVVGSSSPRNLAVVYRLEGSDIYCYGT